MSIPITKYRLLKAVEWNLYFCLCFISVLFMKEVLEKYCSKDSSFKQYNKPITEHPTITICFSSTIENNQSWIHSRNGNSFQGTIPCSFGIWNKNHSFFWDEELLELEAFLFFTFGMHHSFLYSFVRKFDSFSN